MGQKSSLSKAQHAQIAIPQKKRYSEQLISERVRLRKNAVHNAIIKLKEMWTYSKAKSCGRLGKTTPRDDHVIRRTAV